MDPVPATCSTPVPTRTSALSLPATPGADSDPLRGSYKHLAAPTKAKQAKRSTPGYRSHSTFRSTPA
ncbi:unnamed protein product [Caretta caretta]